MQTPRSVMYYASRFNLRVGMKPGDAVCIKITESAAYLFKIKKIVK